MTIRVRVTAVQKCLQYVYAKRQKLIDEKPLERREVVANEVELSPLRDRYESINYEDIDIHAPLTLIIPSADDMGQFQIGSEHEIEIRPAGYRKP